VLDFDPRDMDSLDALHYQIKQQIGCYPMGLAMNILQLRYTDRGVRYTRPLDRGQDCGQIIHYLDDWEITDYVFLIGLHAV